MPGRGRGRPPHPGTLTPAEQRVLEELRRGGTNVEIAVRLGLSPETVKTHIASMLGKLGLDDRHTLASWRPDRDRKRFPGLLALPPALASLGRPFLWAGAALGGVAVVAVAVVLLVAFLGDEDEHMVLSPTEVGSCDSGVAVPSPTTNTELVEDCESLLKARDRLAGTATLNWSGGRPMTNWIGVTVAGTPQRVTKLELADSGLTGELTGLLGNLTALTHLRLNANALTGKIPSKLQLLTALTHLYLANDALTDCVPASLRTVTNNDLATLNLPDCTPPRRVSDEPRVPLLEGGQTVSYQDLGRGPVFVVDLPEGYTFTIQVELGQGGPDRPSKLIAVIVTHEGGYNSLVVFDLDTGKEYYYFISGEGGFHADGRRFGAQTEPSDARSPLNDVFSRISESAWLQE